MSDTSARLDLPFLLPAQAQKHVTHNEALQKLDTLTQLVVEARNADIPPAAPEIGEIHALGDAPQGEWAGQAGMLAQWTESAWVFIPPRAGWRAWDQATESLCCYRDGTWRDVVPALQDLDGVGIGTVSDATNRLALASSAALFSHVGDDHRLTINKAGDSDTASLLYQSGWTGHAEIGLTGDTDFHIKVSADGSSWTEALTISATSGLLGGAAVQAAPTDATPGRLMRADYGYGPGNLLGIVSQSGGVPDGAVIERGSNADGTYVRWADGTQICWQAEDIAIATVPAGGIFSDTSSAGPWAFPRPFAATPAVQFAPHGDGTWGTVASVDTASAERVIFSATPTSGTQATHSLAVGRWF